MMKKFVMEQNCIRDTQILGLARSSRKWSRLMFLLFVPGRHRIARSIECGIFGEGSQITIRSMKALFSIF